jgi:aminoglycoside 6'-N-acetyltransferase
MARGGYQFQPLRTADLAMVRQWLAMPHVAEWWGDADQQTEDGPFGYLQCYDLRAWPCLAFASQPDGTRAIDQFIGKPEMVGCGHGSGFIRQFIDELLADGAPRVITDPAPNNSRAIRAYEKAGFVRDRLIETSDGPAVLMVRSP